ncbi:hypothetical protein PC129_g21622 [Phytophthora cactorum]|uniref:Uncharacterized protein n=1 Tax=Phytophthora cactorum TaxID=29920 RepID=A0A8T1H596_9STRA|nr:hypothetical protein PC122_g22219 [Phytophthora cactorum]KAG3206890.1 hypothetical protein PC129_g21622 [Phytophthora cactorum]
MRIHPTFYVGRLKPYTQHEPSNLDGSQRTTKRRKPASRARQHGHLRDLLLLIAQFLLQLGELHTLELFQSGYTVV